MGKRKKRGLKNRSEDFFNERKKHISTSFIVFEGVSIINRLARSRLAGSQIVLLSTFFWQ
jgi:hypothetical protein